MTGSLLPLRYRRTHFCQHFIILLHKYEDEVVPVLGSALAVEHFLVESLAFLEMIGFDQADIRRIKAQEERVRGMALIDEIANENIE